MYIKCIHTLKFTKLNEVCADLLVDFKSERGNKLQGVS